jgi:RNA recognition motif-containing protein
MLLFGWLRYFSQFGAVEDAVVIMDRDDPGRSRGFGFVTLPSMEAAETVMKSTDGQDLMVSQIFMRSSIIPGAYQHACHGFPTGSIDQSERGSRPCRWRRRRRLRCGSQFTEESYLKICLEIMLDFLN